MTDIIYNLYFCGVHQGKYKVSPNSLVGRLATLDLAGATQATMALVDELNAIENVTASAHVEAAEQERDADA